MYRRLKGLDKDTEEARVDAEVKAEKTRLVAEIAKTNGHVNGTPIKSE